ncbi:hypothetical protein [Bradyrhizobium sp.]|uniref:hypothetical protein n=1 Tax=Bradyrhizobium sp. TaxID=376 RepID=UPI003C345A33
MKKMIISVAVLLLLGDAAALAQSGNRNSSMGTSGAIPEAPVGHRQPRAGEVPDEKNLSNPNDTMNKEDAALDRKIKSICRGC